MLEQKIYDLTAQVETLTKAVETLTAAMQSAPTTLGAKATNPKAEPKTEPEAAPEKPKDDLPAPDLSEQADSPAEQEGPKREDLQDMCMNIVRGDRSKKSAVKAAIAQFDGAETLRDVPENKLGELKAALETI